jgi:hypothetical protein
MIDHRFNFHCSYKESDIAGRSYFGGRFHFASPAAIPRMCGIRSPKLAPVVTGLA